MQYRRFGRTNLKIPILSLGGMRFQKSWEQLNFSEVDLDKATEYAAEDADVTLRLYEILSDKIETEKLNKIYEIFEKPMIKILSKLEIQGIKVDDSYLKELSKKFEIRLKKI